MPTTDNNAIVLVSGGLDSATTLAICREQSWNAFAISFDYGQRHRCELDSARKVCAAAGVEQHITFPLDLSAFGGSALTDATGELAVPKGRDESEMQTGIPITYVPARNTIFLAVALGWAETLSARDIFIGVNAVDYSGYPDCRPEFIRSFVQTANLATKAGVEDGSPFRIHTPLIDLTKAEIIRCGTKLGVDYSLTLSCYDPDADGRACGDCDSCTLRRAGFAEARIADPTLYR